MSNICRAGPRFWFAKEARVPMRDDGVAPDLHAGDGVYVAVIDTAAAPPGSMVRWRAEAAVAPPSDVPRQGLTLIPISAQLELFCLPYNPA